MILIWILSWAALLLIIIYSPIGSPELYEQKNYSIQYQGVDFSAGIANSPTFENYQRNQQYQQYDNPVYVVPNYKSEQKSYSYKTKTIASGTFVETNYMVNQITTDRSIQSHKDYRYTNNDIAYIGLFEKKSKSYSTSDNQDATSLTADLTEFGNPNARQLASAGALDGGTDPGGDPAGPPIPVGDGFWFLILLVIGYSGWKMICTLKRNKIKGLRNLDIESTSKCLILNV